MNGFITVITYFINMFILSFTGKCLSDLCSLVTLTSYDMDHYVSYIIYCYSGK